MTRDRLVAAYLHHASDRLHTFAHDGSPLGEIALPGIGSLVTLDADSDDRRRPVRLYVVRRSPERLDRSQRCAESPV